MRMGFWGPSYYDCNKEHPKIVLNGNYLGPPLPHTQNPEGRSRARKLGLRVQGLGTLLDSCVIPAQGPWANLLRIVPISSEDV